MENKNSGLRSSKIDKIEEFDEPLAMPGKIFLAEIHGSAQHFLKIKKLSKYIRFCKCCLLPSETPGVVIPYTCLDNKEDFGIGIQLYFSYIFFCIIICLSSIFLCTIPSMVFSKRYYDDLIEYCETYFNNNNTRDKLNEELNTNNENCYKYIDIINKQVIEEQSVITTDWILKFSADNIVNYYNLYKEKAKDPNKITDVLFSYSFMYFLTAIILLIINFFFIHYAKLINDKEDFESTTPRDYTLLIHGVKRPDNKTSKIQHLKNILSEISNNFFKLEIYQIIPCYNLVELYKLTKTVFEDKIKIYHAYNFKRQKNLHKLYMKQHRTKEDNLIYKYNNINRNQSLEGQNLNDINKDTKLNIHQINQSNVGSQIDNLIDQNNNNNNILKNLNKENNDIYIHDDNLNYYSKILWIVTATPLNKIEQRIAQNNQRIKAIEKDLIENPDRHSSGIYFVVFKYIRMKDKFYDFYPTSFTSKILIHIKYLFQNILFANCVEEKTKRKNYLRTQIIIENATEAYEVIWQNMGYTYCKKAGYLLLSIAITIVLICISFGIIYFLNSIQFDLTEDDDAHKTYEYLLSFLISIVIALINSLGRKILKYITKTFETNESKTNYYISLSLKITIFTFINTDIVPLLSNHFQKDWNDYDILLNNIFMIFLMNFTLNPLVFYLNPNLLIKLSKRAKARNEIEGLPLEESTYTQFELNKLFQNPSMSLCYKYSFYSNVILTTFFYMSLFPLGVVFSFVGLVLAYFLEIVHLGFYKRPELLNSRLCKFFVNNFKVAMAVFAVGNFVFLRDAEKHYDIDWSLINLILFLVIVIIPYQSIKFNLLGVTEGEITKGPYNEYELMFPTDYEKQNPLTKKTAMIKYFKQLRKMNLIDEIQSSYLIDKVKSERTMVNYYKTSQNVGNILNYYEFQNQFVKLKKKSKFLKDIKNRRIQKNNYDLYINKKARERRETLASINNFREMRKSSAKRRITDASVFKNKDLKILDSPSNSEYSQLGYDKKYKIKGVVENDPIYRRKVSRYMRKALFQSVKDQGLYSDTEEESDEDSFKSEEIEELNKSRSNDSLSNSFKEDEENKKNNN